MAFVGGSAYTSPNNPSSRPPEEAGGAAGDLGGVSDFYSRLHSDQYPSSDMTQNFAQMLLGIALRILHPDMTRREEMLMYGQQPAPGVPDAELRNPNVSPLAIRRMG